MEELIFANYVAKILNIKIRFVGEEPNDYVTKQFNSTLKRILPLYGIDVIEIPRKEFQNRPISASDVRRYISSEKYEEIINLVPKSTYSFIISNYYIKKD